MTLKRRNSHKEKTKKKKKFNKNLSTKKCVYRKKRTNVNKKNNGKNNTKSKRRGGMSGITLKKGLSKKDAFDFFIKNSIVEYVSKGSFGVTFKAKLNKEYISQSPYKSTDSATYGEPVSTILFKLVFINDNTGKNGSTLSSFYGEVNIQEDVYFKTMDYLEPICPAVVYSNVYTESPELNKIQLLEQIKNSTLINTYANKLLDYFISSQDVLGSIGVIAMEFADGYQTLHTFESKNNGRYDFRTDVKSAAMYLILELAVKTGYSHADFHGGNIMILQGKNGKKLNYFNFNDGQSKNEVKSIYNKTPPYSSLLNFKGKPLLIDFGLAVKIPEETLTRVIKLYKAGNYIKALKLISMVPRRDGSRIDTAEWKRHYGWVWNYDDEKDKENITEMNNLIKGLINARENAIKIVKETFNKEHPDEPQLPLTDEGKMDILQENSLEDGSLKNENKESTKSEEISTIQKNNPEKEELEEGINKFKQSNWQEVTLPDGRKYWWNKFSRETTWINPYGEPDNDQKLSSIINNNQQQAYGLLEKNNGQNEITDNTINYTEGKKIKDMPYSSYSGDIYSLTDPGFNKNLI